jgi:hypothetical protein
VSRPSFVSSSFNCTTVSFLKSIRVSLSARQKPGLSPRPNRQNERVLAPSYLFMHTIHTGQCISQLTFVPPLSEKKVALSFSCRDQQSSKLEMSRVFRLVSSARRRGSVSLPRSRRNQIVTRSFLSLFCCLLWWFPRLCQWAPALAFLHSHSLF